MSEVQSTKHNVLGFRDFLIGDLFDVKTTPNIDRGRLTDLADTPINGYYPFIGRTHENNGIQGYTQLSEEYLNKGQTISVSQVGTICALYQPEAWYASQNIFLIDVSDYSENVAMWILAKLNKSFMIYENGWSTRPTLDSLKSTTIQLPVLANNQPDYEYMDYFVEELKHKYVEELKHKYVEELDAWWSQAGFASLSDTLLTGNDRNILNKYQQAQFKDFLIGDLFDVKGTNQVFQNDELDVHDNQTDIYNVPYVVRKDGDNGIKGYVDGSLVHSDDLNQGNVITFAQDTFVSYYQPYPFITGNKIKILIFKDGDLSFNLSQWFVSGINKLIKGLSWGTGSTVASIKELTIQLPVDINDQPDYDLISHYMQVMKKLTIQTHRAWLDEQLVAYQSLI